MQLNTIALNWNQLCREKIARRDFVSDDRASRHHDDLVDRLIEVKPINSWRRLPDVVTDAADDIFRSIGVPYDAAERFPDFPEIGRIYLQKTRGRASIVARSGDRMQNFVSQRSGQCSHYAQAVHVGEIRLQLV